MDLSAAATSLARSSSSTAAPPPKFKAAPGFSRSSAEVQLETPTGAGDSLGKQVVGNKLVNGVRVLLK